MNYYAEMTVDELRKEVRHLVLIIRRVNNLPIEHWMRLDAVKDELNARGHVEAYFEEFNKALQN